MQIVDKGTERPKCFFLRIGMQFPRQCWLKLSIKRVDNFFQLHVELVLSDPLVHTFGRYLVETAVRKECVRG